MINFPIQKLVQWYRKNKRDLPWRQTKDIYKIWLSEVMLQQTQVKTVIPYYLAFIERYPTIDALAAADEDELLKRWEGLGYYKRCHNLHLAAQRIVKENNSEIPDIPGKFYSLPGVGPYIKAAVMSIVYGYVLPAVDTNVIRVYSRFTYINEKLGRTSILNLVNKELEHIIPHDNPGEFNQAMMELGALVCLPKKPHCTICPLSEECLAKQHGQQEAIPTKKKPREVPKYQVSVAVICKRDEPGTFYIQKRHPDGHLGGMWEFPGGKKTKTETSRQTLLREIKEELGIDIKIIGKISQIDHAYSHFKVQLHFFYCRLPKSSPADMEDKIKPLSGMPYRWLTIDQVDELPFPGANIKFFPRLRYFLEHTVKKNKTPS